MHLVLEIRPRSAIPTSKFISFTIISFLFCFISIIMIYYFRHLFKYYKCFINLSYLFYLFYYFYLMLNIINNKLIHTIRWVVLYILILNIQWKVIGRTFVLFLMPKYISLYETISLHTLSKQKLGRTRLLRISLEEALIGPPREPWF